MKTISMKTAELASLSERALTLRGVPPEDAALVADHLLTAEACHMPSHGLMRLPFYIRRIETGFIAADPKVMITPCAPGLLSVDGGLGLGIVVTQRALDALTPLAKSQGVAAAAIAHSNHLGMAGYYTQRAARNGLIAFLCTNAGPSMPPFGGMTPMLGTNPFAFSAPNGADGAFTIDMATTSVARGKIRLMAEAGKPIPKGWALDVQGNDTEDAAAAYNGMMLPTGGHKGFGLAMMVDVLTAMLSGADLSIDGERMFDNARPANTGAFLVVLDLTRFLSKEEYDRRMADWIARLRSAKCRPGVDAIHIPGDTMNGLQGGLPERLTLPQDLLSQLKSLAEPPERSAE